MNAIKGEQEKAWHITLYNLKRGLIFYAPDPYINVHLMLYTNIIVGM